MLARQLLEGGEVVECAVSGCDVQIAEFGVEGRGAEEACYGGLGVCGAESG